MNHTGWHERVNTVYAGMRETIERNAVQVQGGKKTPPSRVYLRPIELEVGVFQHLVNPIRRARLFLQELRPVPRQIA